MQNPQKMVIYNEKVKLHYSLMAGGLSASIINASIVTFLHYSLVPSLLLFTWAGSLIIFSFLRFALLHYYKKSLDSITDFRKWNRFFIAGLIVAGSMWGAASFFMLFHHFESHKVLVAFVIGGMTAGVAGTFSAFRWSYYGFAVPAILPQIVLFLVEGNPIDVSMATMLSLYAILISVPAERNRSTIDSTLRLRYEREDLINSLSAEKERTDAAVILLETEIGRRIETENELRTTQRELEKKVKERTAELLAFIYSVSHDLRNPLHKIDFFSSLIERELNKGQLKKTPEHLLKIQKSSKRMQSIINDLLLLSKVTQTEIQRSLVNLSTLAKEMALELKNQEPERPVEFIISSSIKVMGDPGLLKIMMENLIGNAWKYTSKNAKARIEFGVKKEEGKIQYYVSDNGIGFDMTLAGRLFMPFERLHADKEFEGIGLGLTTVKRIIERHGGSIWVKSEKGKGTAFYFTL